jgi:hypothetical protein
MRRTQAAAQPSWDQRHFSSFPSQRNVEARYPKVVLQQRGKKLNDIRARHVAIRSAAIVLTLAGLGLFTTVRPGVTAAHADTWTETARIKAIFVQVPMMPVGGMYFPPQTFVSFQTETPDGQVVMTQPGDSPVNLDSEQAALRETPKRRSQVDQLRQAMQSAGWTELGVDGEWFEYTFGQ